MPIADRVEARGAEWGKGGGGGGWVDMLEGQEKISESRKANKNIKCKPWLRTIAKLCKRLDKHLQPYDRITLNVAETLITAPLDLDFPF